MKSLGELIKKSTYETAEHVSENTVKSVVGTLDSQAREFFEFSKISSRIPLSKPKLVLPSENDRLSKILQTLSSLKEEDRKSEKTSSNTEANETTYIHSENLQSRIDVGRERQNNVFSLSKLDLYSGSVHRNMYHYFVDSRGSADIATAQLLTHIIKWSLPKSGTAFDKRFHHDYLHLLYRDLQKEYRCTRKEVRRSIKKLEELGFIETFLDKITCTIRNRRKVLTNRMMIKLNVKKLSEIIPEKTYTKRGKRKIDYDRVKFFEPEGVEIKPLKESEEYLGNVQSKLSMLNFYNGQIPSEFFNTFVDKTGYSNRLACALMTMIVSFYLPKKSGVLSKRFFHEYLHFTYEDLQKHFNVSRKQLEHAFGILRSHGVMSTDYKVTYREVKGVKTHFANSMMIKIDIDRISEILTTKKDRQCGTVDQTSMRSLPGSIDLQLSTSLSAQRYDPYEKGQTCTYVSPPVSKDTSPPRGGGSFFGNYFLNTSSDSKVKPYIRKLDRGKRRRVSTESGIEGVLWGDLRKPWANIMRERSILVEAIEDFKGKGRFFMARAISQDFKMSSSWERVGLQTGIEPSYIRQVFNDFKDHFGKVQEDGRRIYKENWFHTWQEWCQSSKKRHCDRIPDYTYETSTSISERKDPVHDFKVALTRKIGEPTAQNIFKYSRVYFEEETLMITTSCAATGNEIDRLSDKDLRESAQANVWITIQHPVFPDGKKVKKIHI